MHPSQRSFRLAAGQRLQAAEFLLHGKLNLDAMYLAGYAIECALKSLILARTDPDDLPAMADRISRGRKMHDFETRNIILGQSNSSVPLVLLKKLRRGDWSTDIRHETGLRDYGESRAFLKTAALVLHWVDGGVL